jgi:predicted lipid-binding transport protein (Tim44 family)
MKIWALALITLFTFGLVSFDAEAKRFGGARSIGKQREAISQQAAPRAPAQQQAAPATPPAQQPSGASRWLGPLAGLALGAGLASLFLNNGLAGMMAGLLLMLAIAAGVMFLVRMLRTRAAQHSPMQYAGATPGRTAPAVEPVFRTAGGAAPHSVAATTGSAQSAGAYPAGFDAAEFVRHAKLNFVRLQSANDAGDLSTISDFLTADLYREIEADVRSRGSAAQKTEVTTLEAQVLEVTTEGEHYIVSVRFDGLIREAPDAQPEPFTEIWHLEKPVRGASGWLLAGIQQG